MRPPCRIPARTIYPGLLHRTQPRRTRPTPNLLDDPIWHALTGPYVRLALGRGAACHYPRQISPISAIAEPAPAAYADFAVNLPTGSEAVLFRSAGEPAPPGWETLEAKEIPFIPRIRLKKAKRRPQAALALMVPKTWAMRH
jgi:hypothetical protein